MKMKEEPSVFLCGVSRGNFAIRAKFDALMQREFAPSALLTVTTQCVGTISSLISLTVSEIRALKI
jgi:hypothetical protein